MASAAKHEAYDHLIRLLVVGDCGTGKTSILYRFADDSFTPSYIATIGVDFKIRTISHAGNTYKMQIWDTSGQERFRSITSSYYRGAQIVIVVYAGHDRLSYTNATTVWLKQCETLCTPGAGRMLVCHSFGDRTSEVPIAEARGWAATHSMPFHEVDAKANRGLEALFQDAAKLSRDLAKTTTVVPPSIVAPKKEESKSFFGNLFSGFKQAAAAKHAATSTTTTTPSASPAVPIEEKKTAAPSSTTSVAVSTPSLAGPPPELPLRLHEAWNKLMAEEAAERAEIIRIADTKRADIIRRANEAAAVRSTTTTTTTTTTPVASAAAVAAATTKTTTTPVAVVSAVDANGAMTITDSSPSPPGGL